MFATAFCVADILELARKHGVDRGQPGGHAR
jgi:hypothetical protein